jgi:hypothetical protein
LARHPGRRSDKHPFCTRSYIGNVRSETALRSVAANPEREAGQVPPDPANESAHTTPVRTPDRVSKRDVREASSCRFPTSLSGPPG